MAKVFHFPKRGGAVGDVPAGVILQVGSRGQAVTDVQVRLHFLGYPLVNASGLGTGIDGVYGLLTQKAVSQFQVDIEGLTVTGVVDKATWDKLDAAARAKGFKEPTAPPVRGSPEYNRTVTEGVTYAPPPTPETPPQNTPFFQTDFGKKSIVVLGGIAGIALLAYIVKGDGKKLPRTAMNGYSRFLSDVSSNVRNSERRSGPQRTSSKVGTRSSTRKSCGRTPAGKMLVDAEVLSPEE